CPPLADVGPGWPRPSGLQNAAKDDSGFSPCGGSTGLQAGDIEKARMWALAPAFEGSCGTAALGCADVVPARLGRKGGAKHRRLFWRGHGFTRGEKPISVHLA